MMIHMQHFLQWFMLINACHTVLECATFIYYQSPSTLTNTFNLSPLIDNIDRITLQSSTKKTVANIKKYILSYFIGPDNASGILNITPRDYRRIPSSFQNVSMPKFTYNVKAWLDELIIYKDRCIVASWDDHANSIIIYDCWAPSYRNTFSCKFSKESLISAIAYKKSFALYDFTLQSLTLINPDRPSQIQDFPLTDFAQCRTSKSSKWLWNLHAMHRYNITNGVRDVYHVNDREKEKIKKLIKYECATSQDGSTSISYFAKCDKDPVHGSCLIIWNGTNAHIKKILPLERSESPGRFILSSTGRYLTYDVPLGDVVGLKTVDLHTNPIQESFYLFQFPMEWSIVAKGHNILVVHGSQKLHFINPYLNMDYPIYLGTKKKWHKPPLLFLNSCAKSMVYCPAIDSDAKNIIYRSTMSTGRSNQNIKFVKLNNLNLNYYSLKHIEFAYALIQALNIALADEQAIQARKQTGRVLVDLYKGLPAYAQFMALPREIFQFFLDMYGVPRGRLQVQGESPSIVKNESWAKLLK
jgi:hypothetical protein